MRNGGPTSTPKGEGRHNRRRVGATIGGGKGWAGGAMRNRSPKEARRRHNRRRGLTTIGGGGGGAMRNKDPKGGAGATLGVGRSHAQ